LKSGVNEKGFISFAARESRGTETAGRRESDETARVLGMGHWGGAGGRRLAPEGLRGGIGSGAGLTTSDLPERVSGPRAEQVRDGDDTLMWIAGSWGVYGELFRKLTNLQVAGHLSAGTR
jgi:hypothetical protein